MNSDKFDRVVMDLLYDELDELTTLAAHRHMAQSARARDIYTQFKATRQLATLPSHSPPPDFTDEVLKREREAREQLPLPQRTDRLVSVLAGYAMRPQLIMGTVLLLMIGSSLVLLRARPGQHGPMQVTERGAPEADSPRVVAVPPPTLERGNPSHGVLGKRASRKTSPLKAARRAGARMALGRRPFGSRNAGSKSGKSGLNGTEEGPGISERKVRRRLPASGLSPFDQAVEVYREGRYLEAQHRFERLARRNASAAPAATLYAARSVRMASGCAPAIQPFEKVRLKFPGSPSAHEATWRSADCMIQIGNLDAARANYESLVRVPEFSKRANRALRRVAQSLARKRRTR